MSHFASPEARPEHLVLREMFARELGWRPAAGERREVEVDGRRLLVVPLGARPPAVALLCEPLSGAALPGYAARRRIRARLRRLFPRHLAVFTDAAHSVQVWSWEGRDPGGPLAGRELGRRPGPPDAEWVRTARSIARELEGAGRTPRARPAPEGVRDAALRALLRRVRRSLPAAFAPGAPLARPGAPGQRVQDAIERSGDPAVARAFWRALAGLAVLDPACGAGGWLLAVLEALEPVYAACLERMQAWVDEEERRAGRGRGGRLRDFRAALEVAGDPSRFPSRRHFAREAIVLRSLFGAERDGEALAAAELSLLLRLHPPGAEDPAAATAPRGLACNLREGDPAAGFPDAEELRAALAAEGREAALRALEEEAETVTSAEGALRDLRLAHGAPAAELLAGWRAVRLRRLALAAELDRLLARREGVRERDPGALAAWLAARRPLHRWAEYPAVLRGGGFALERGREP